MGSRRGFTSLFKGTNDYEYTRLGAQVQNVQDKTVYVFGDGDVCEEDVVEFEMETIRSRKSQRSHNIQREKPLYVERQIAEGDTLHSLCLQYGCPVSEMKRVNNLINDQDFHALTRIKIPVKHNSFLIEQIENDSREVDKKRENAQVNGAAAATYAESEEEYEVNTESDKDVTTDLSDPETQKQVIRKISIKSAARSDNSEAQKFLENMDRDLSKIMNSKRTDRQSLDEVISVLTNKSVHPLVQKRPNTWTFFSVQYKTAIVIFMVIAIFVPLVFLVRYIHNSGKGS